MLRLLRVLRRVILIALGGALFALAGSAAWVLIGTVRQDLTPTNAIVVLGAAQFDGDPSPVLENRLDRALRLYRKGIAKRIVTVGGKRAGDRFTEAETGRNYLMRKGVPANAITAVSTGSDTYSSMVAVSEYAHAQGWERLTVVTDRCHVARATSMLASFTFGVHPASPREGPGSSVTVGYLFREASALLEFKLLQSVGQQGRLADRSLVHA